MFRVRIEITGSDDVTEEIYDHVVVEKLILSDSYQENSEEFAAVLDGALNIIYTTGLPFKIQAVWDDE